MQHKNCEFYMKYLINSAARSSRYYVSRRKIITQVVSLSYLKTGYVRYYF